MTSSFSQPVVCPVLIGRDEALASLRAVLQSSDERGRVALISGQAGIGKSRLLAEFLAKSSALGWRGLVAGFFEQDAGLPYSAIVRLLAYMAANKEDARQLAPFAPDLGLVSPEVARMHQARDVEGTSGDAGQSAKLRFLQALTSAVGAIVAAGPTIIAFEDVHWADPASLEALLYLARDTHPGRLLIFTYRDDEDPNGLSSVLAELDRQRVSSEIRLAGLGVTQVDDMLRACLNAGHSTRADVLHAIHQLTAGNPFFVEEVTRSILDSSGGVDGLDSLRLADFDLPRGLNEAVRRRTQGLSGPARELLALAAVAGQRFELPLLLEIANRGATEVLAAIKELIAQQLVVEESEDNFAFRHALTREAVRSGLLRRERRELSLRIGLAIEKLHAGDEDARLEDLSRHFHEAAEWQKALQYAVRAGRQALRLYAAGPALTHLNRAIDAGGRLDGADLADAYRLRGAANEAVGDFESARADYEAAAADTSPDALTRWQALLDLGLLWAARDYGRAEPYLRQALDLARDRGDQATIARSLGRLGNWHLNVGDVDSALAMSEEALAILRELGDEAGIAQTLDLLGITCTLGMRFDQAAIYYREAIARLEALDDRRTLASALASIQIGSSSCQTDMMPPSLTLAEGSAFGERALAITREMGWKPDQSYALWQLASTTAPQGQPSRGLAYATEAVAIAREIGHTQWQTGAECVLGSILTDVLATDEGFLHLRRAQELAQAMNSRLWVGQAQGLMIDALLAARQTAAALELYESVASNDLSDFGPRELYTSGTDAFLAAGDIERSLAMLSRLEAEAERHSPGRTAIRLQRMHARALVASGQLEAGIEMTIAARDAARRQGHVSHEWRLSAELSHALLAHGDRDSARTVANEAIARIELVASRIDDEPLRRKFRERAILLLPATLRRHATTSAGEILTSREQEIASLVAQGLTSRDIAERLVLSSRTVESHVANAMAKLGFTTRSQLAAWAVEHGRNASDS